MWRQLDSVDLDETLRTPVRTVRDPPRWFRGSLLKAYGIALREWQRRATPAAWKLFLLVPRMLLRPTDERGEAGKHVFQHRMRRFQKGEWLPLLEEAASSNRDRPASKVLDAEAVAQRRAEQVEAKSALARGGPGKSAAYYFGAGTRHSRHSA